MSDEGTAAGWQIGPAWNLDDPADYEGQSHAANFSFGNSDRFAIVSSMLTAVPTLLLNGNATQLTLWWASSFFGDDAPFGFMAGRIFTGSDGTGFSVSQYGPPKVLPASSVFGGTAPPLTANMMELRAWASSAASSLV